MSTLKKIFVVAIMLFACTSAFSQFDVKVSGTRMSNSFFYDSMRIDRKTVNMEQTTFRNMVLNMKVKDTTTGKIMREFFRIDDKNYYYQEFNVSGKSLSEGNLNIREKVLETADMPLFDSTGVQIGKKVLQFVELYFLKTGFWWETASDGSSCSGNYLNNLKEGNWIYAKYLEGNSGVNYKTEVYKTGKLLKTELLEVPGKDEIRTRRMLTGQWELDNPLIVQSTDSVWAFHKAPVQNQNNYYLRFDSTGNGFFKLKVKDGKNKMELHRAPQKDAKNRVVYFDENGKKLFTILFLSPQQLIMIVSFE